MSAISSRAVVLEAAGVRAGYGDRAILDGLDLRVHAGEVVALLGANGAGKSTTLALFLGFVVPQAGRVRVAGCDPARDPAGARGQLGYLPETVALYEHLSARENIAYLLELAGQPRPAAEVDEALMAAGLPAVAHGQRTGGFSKGMRQKVAIALALLRHVPALLLDEPTSGLDPQATAEFNRLVGLLRARGMAVLMVTHDLLGAADVADRIGFLAGGRLALAVAAQEEGPDRYDVRALHRRYAEVPA